MKLLYTLVYSILFFSLYVEASTLEKRYQNFHPTEIENRAGAVVLEKNVHISIDTNGKKKEVRHYVIAILSDEAARDYGQIYTTFNSYYSSKKLDFARIINQDGTVKEVKKDAVQIQNPQNYNSYDDSKILSFSLPSIQKNSIIEFQITSTTTKNIIANEAFGSSIMHFWQIHSSSKRMRLDPVRKSSLQIDIDKSRRLFFNENRVSNVKITQKSLITSYKWEISNLKRVKIEEGILTPYSEMLPSISYSTMEDWKSINSYFSKSFDEASFPSAKIKNLALSLTNSKMTQHEKIVSIYNYMQQNIKYIFAHFGKGGMLPHKADEVLANLYGDCKDQTVLFIALLKALNIEAYPSLLNASGVKILDNSAPSPTLFNHVIVYIPSENSWVDTVGYKSVYPGLSWQVNHKKTLLLNYQDVNLKKIVFNDLQTVNVEVELKDLEDKISGTFHFKPRGDLSSFYKSKLANSQDAKIKIENSFRQIYKNTKVTNFEILNIDNPSKYIEIKFNFEINNPAIDKDELKYYSSVIQNIVLMSLPLTSLPKPEDRIYGYLFGYKVKNTIKTVIYPATKAIKATFIKIPSSFKSKFYDYDFSYKISADKIEIHDSLFFKKNRITREEYDLFYRKSSELFNDISWLLQTKKDEFQEKEFQLKEELAQNSSGDKMLELVEHFLSASNYEKAKTNVIKLIEKEPNNAKAHYLYGVVLGYMDEFDKSDAEFSKARELGYEE